MPAVSPVLACRPPWQPHPRVSRQPACRRLWPAAWRSWRVPQTPAAAVHCAAQHVHGDPRVCWRPAPGRIDQPDRHILLGGNLAPRRSMRRPRIARPSPACRPSTSRRRHRSSGSPPPCAPQASARSRGLLAAAISFSPSLIGVPGPKPFNGISMFDCPDANQTSPTRRSDRVLSTPSPAIVRGIRTAGCFGCQIQAERPDLVRHSCNRLLVKCRLQVRAGRRPSPDVNRRLPLEHGMIAQHVGQSAPQRAAAMGAKAKKRASEQNFIRTSPGEAVRWGV